MLERQCYDLGTILRSAVVGSKGESIEPLCQYYQVYLAGMPRLTSIWFTAGSSKPDDLISSRCLMPLYDRDREYGMKLQRL